MPDVLSFAKTGAALLSVTIATVSGVGRPDGRGGWLVDKNGANYASITVQLPGESDAWQTPDRNRSSLERARRFFLVELDHDERPPRPVGGRVW